jgi:RNA polymerase sigma-70 factor (ECF subfamily)
MKLSQIQEKTVVAGILKGDRKSLRFFYNNFYPPLRSFIKKRVSVDHDAEEVLQDTLLGALDSLRDFSFKSSLFTFLCSIANHKVIDYYRRKKIKNIVFSSIPDAEDILGTLIGPEEEFDHVMLKGKIKEAFSNLNPLYKDILDLKYVQGYSVEEIAHKLKLTFKSVESHLFRARKAFAIVFERK